MSRAALTRSGRPKIGIGYSHEFLERLAHILVQSGHSPKKLLREFRSICNTLKEPRHPWNPALLGHLADIPHVIAYWHAHPDFTDARGRPAPLALSGRRRSLTALVARVLPHEEPLEVVRSLIRLRGIRRRGKYYQPTGRQLVMTQQRAGGRVHGLNTLLGILRTIDHNVTRAPQLALLERTAVNPRFPVRELPHFHRRLKSWAADFLWAADDHMRRRETRSRSGPVTRLGVGVFAFEDPMITGRRPTVSARRGQKRVSAVRSLHKPKSRR